MSFNLNPDSINYIKITYKDKDNAAICTKAVIKRIGEREIFSCAKFEDDIDIQTPQDVALSFVCDNGLYTTLTTLKFIDNKPPYVFFTLRTPDELEYHQSREFFRVKADESAILNIDGNIMISKIYDVSAKGVRLVVPQKVEAYDNVIIEMMFNAGSVKTRTKFIRFDDEDGILKASFEFVEIPENDVDFISQVCIKKQLEYKRKNAKK